MDDELDIWDQPQPKAEKKPNVSGPDAGGVGNFIKYNNTVPIILGILFLSTSGALAASPEVRDSVISSKQSVKSVDNSYLLAVNVESFPFSATVTGVKEDGDSYYVSYTLHTIDLVDSVWRPVDKTQVLEVDKRLLTETTLGDFTTKQLVQVKDGERERFRVAQDSERKHGASNKVVATEYSGIIGSLIGSRDTVATSFMDGPEQDPETGSDPNRLTTPQTLIGADGSTSVAAVAASGGSTSGGTPVNNGDTEAPTISLLGDSQITIDVGSPYTDLGVAVGDNMSPVPTPHIFVNGKPATTVQLDTSHGGTYSIVYQVQDAAGNHSQTTRTVTILGQSVSAPAPEFAPEPPPSSDPAPSS